MSILACPGPRRVRLTRWVSPCFPGGVVEVKHRAETEFELELNQEIENARTVEDGVLASHKRPGVVTEAILEERLGGRFGVRLRGEAAEDQEKIENAGRTSLRLGRRYRRLIALEMLRRKTRRLSGRALDEVVTRCRRAELEGKIPGQSLRKD